MINISVDANEKSVGSSTKIDVAFKSLETYINEYTFKECCSNVCVISDVCCLPNVITPTMIYAYSYNECVPYGLAEGNTFKKCNCRFITERVICGNNGCMVEGLTYTYPQGPWWGETSCVLTAWFCTGACPTIIRSTIYTSCLGTGAQYIWPCIVYCRDPIVCNEMRVPNLVQLACNTWFCYGDVYMYTYLVGYPIVPIAGATMMELCTRLDNGLGTGSQFWCNWAIGQVPQYRVPMGVPLVFKKSGESITDAFCPQFFCVCLNNGQQLTLLEYNKCACGSNPNNTLLVNLPDIISDSLLFEASDWIQEYCDKGYCLYSLWPMVWMPYSSQSGGEWSPVRATYCRQGAVKSFITFGETNLEEEDIAQIVITGKGMKAV